MGEQVQSRWVTRPWLALTVRIAVLAVPLAASFGAAELLRRALPAGLPRWGVALLMAATAVAVGLTAERIARRLLPLSSLLSMTMLFPDRAPSRLRVFRGAASTRQLRTRLAGPDADAAEAASATLALITALGGHDRRTRGHSERVRMFADLLGEELGLSETDRDRLRWAALLHDIGKLEIAAQVLNKPGELDAQEWERVRAHPLDGARLAGPLMDWLGEWSGGIPEHHERYDGTGYPLGLSGEAISRAGRMVAVIDAFETMTATRTYKQPLNTLAARAELARCAGTHFDPQMVRAFLNISLPRLLWAMGPVALLVHLPFLRAIETAGSHVGTAVATGAGATVLAVGAAVVPAAPTAPAPVTVFEVETVRPTGTAGPNVARLLPSPASTRGAPPTRGPSGVPVHAAAPVSSPTEIPSTPPVSVTPPVPDRPPVDAPARPPVSRPRFPAPGPGVPTPGKLWPLPVPLPPGLPVPRLPLPPIFPGPASTPGGPAD